MSEKVISALGDINIDSKSSKLRLQLDQSFTEHVKASPGNGCEARTRQLYRSLVQHMHDFVRENEVTMDEFMAGVELMNAAGAMSSGQRNEGLLLMDIFGLESLVDEITQKKLLADTQARPEQVYSGASGSPSATASAILGPFWRKDAPRYPMDADIVQRGGNKSGKGVRTYMHGRVVDSTSAEPIEGAELDVWHAAANGLYEQQDPEQPEMNLRGRFTTAADGRYAFYCQRPPSYPLPNDGPSAKVLRSLDRHIMRPGHIHFIITAPGYDSIVTQIFDADDEFIHDDTVFAVKEKLKVHFRPVHDCAAKANFDVAYDFSLVRSAAREPDPATET